MILLDGKVARAHFTSLLTEKVHSLPVSPHLVIIQVGNRPDSDSFIKAKKSYAEKIGARETHVQLPSDCTQEDILKSISTYNTDSDVHGIIVQLPLPSHLNADIVTEAIDPAKDVDGLTSHTKFTPATARGIRELLQFYNISLDGKKVTVLGRSKLVGTPIAEMCRKQGAIVTVCHSETEDIPEKARGADLLIVAIGKAQLVDHTYVSPGQIVIDVGISRTDEGLVGDVNFKDVENIVSMITPVPGGVGQMTVLALFENLIDAWYTTPHITR